jgi:hypothetical protein
VVLAQRTATTASSALGRIALTCAIASCFPRSDLDGYSIVEPGAGGTGQIPMPAQDAGTTDSGTGGSEGIDDMVPIAQQPDSGAELGSGGTGPTLQPDAGEPGCSGTGEFESTDGESCYLASIELASWLAAQEACQEWGGDLVKLETAAEGAFVAARITTDVWIGANDRDQEGDFEWTDGDNVGAMVFDWSDTQPDNFQDQEHCVEIRIIDRQWNDRPCTGDPQAYLCER